MGTDGEAIGRPRVDGQEGRRVMSPGGHQVAGVGGVGRTSEARPVGGFHNVPL